MTEPTSAQEALGAFLRNLRGSWDDANVTQKQLADALGASPALVSSWESASAVPPEDRLKQYARFFCTHRSIDTRPAALIPGDDLNPDEERERELLIDKLVRLREEALQRPASARRDTGALGGRFWFFADGQPVTILCTRFSNEQLVGERAEELERDGISTAFPPAQQYLFNPTHPNAVYNLNNGDIDALLELAGHIRAENPAVDVRWMTTDRIHSADDLTGHIVLLGGGDDLIGTAPDSSPARYLTAAMGLPVGFREASLDDPEFSLQFVVRTNADGDPDPSGTKEEVYSPRFRRDEAEPGRPRVLSMGAPILDYDLALIVRRPNPLNASATVTMCSGLFSRGTYGAVRAFTDAILRTRNEQYLTDLVNPADFWMLIQVPVFAGERTITPDLGRPFHRLRTS